VRTSGRGSAGGGKGRFKTRRRTTSGGARSKFAPLDEGPPPLAVSDAEAERDLALLDHLVVEGRKIGAKLLAPPPS
jgi:hypothetical protein